MIDENLLSLDRKLTPRDDERMEGPQILIDIGRNSAEENDSEHDFD